VLLSEDDLAEAALLKYAQRQATSWGAERFAAEFKRRDLEERWLEASRSKTSPYAQTAATDAALPDALAGPVDAAVQENAIETERTGFRLLRPTHERHPSVPRPPAPEPEPGRRRPRHRKHAASTADPAWMITPAERERMTPAGRRLYGLDDPSDAGR
jgi:hypothetical protein